MSRIRGSNTGPERVALSLMHGVGLHPEPQARDLPGRPDFVFRAERLAVFVDGAFWHGWNFAEWRHKLSMKWEEKISANRRRDTRNHRLLRQDGWKVLRIWDFQLEKRPQYCLRRIVRALEKRKSGLAEEPFNGTIHKGDNQPGE